MSSIMDKRVFDETENDAMYISDCKAGLVGHQNEKKERKEEKMRSVQRTH